MIWLVFGFGLCVGATVGLVAGVMLVAARQAGDDAIRDRYRRESAVVRSDGNRPQ